MNMLYEVINPSDAYTLRAPDDELAALAVLCLGSGAYGCERCHDHVVVWPITAFGGDADGTFRRRYGRSLDAVMSARVHELPAVLRSVWIGRPADRLGVEAAMAACDTQRARDALMATRHDVARSSVNDIGAAAVALADALEDKAATA